MYRYFVFIYEFEDLFYSSVKNEMDILFGIALNLYIAFCKLIIILMSVLYSVSIGGVCIFRANLIIFKYLKTFPA